MSAPAAVFLGSKSFGLAMLRALIDAGPTLHWRVVHPEDGADSRTALPDFEAFCAERGIPFTSVPRASDAYAAIRAAAPEIVFVCGWYFLIPPALLESGPRFFGIHNSLLPHYRGGAPLVWAMIRGEPRVGSTLFRITPGMDDGPAYLQVSTEPGLEDGIGDVIAAIENRFLDAIPHAWPAIVRGDLRETEQDHAAATYCGQRRPEDGLIDWSQPAAAVHDFVRAQTRPYPGAFTVAGGKKIRIWRTWPLDAVYCGTPGQILQREKGRVLISCGGHTALAVLEVTDPEDDTSLDAIFPSLSLRLGRGIASEGRDV